MKPTVLSPQAWRAVRDELHTEYPKSVFMLRNKMKTVLGFTVREHRSWISTVGKPDADTNGYYEDQIHLDFYDSRKQTLFMLKYSDIINSADNRG